MPDRSGSSHGDRVAGSTGSTTQKADGTECAHVLCFDWERGAWVPETIEIPAIDAATTTELSEGLKVLIGAGVGRMRGFFLESLQQKNAKDENGHGHGPFLRKMRKQKLAR